MSTSDLCLYYCDINDIPYHTSRAQVTTHIEHHPLHILSYMTPYGRLFEMCRKYQLGVMSLEDCMSYGDIGSQYHDVSYNNSYDIMIIDCVLSGLFGSTPNTILIQ